MHESLKKLIVLTLQEQNSQKDKLFYRMVRDILSDTNAYLYISHFVQPNELCQQLIDMIYNRQIREATARDEDCVLSGIFDVLSLLLSKFPDVRNNLPGKTKLI